MSGRIEHSVALNLSTAERKSGPICRLYPRCNARQMDSSGLIVPPLVGVPGAGEDIECANGEAEPRGDPG